jgi:anti-sigma B factor antagonist
MDIAIDPVSPSTAVIQPAGRLDMLWSVELRSRLLAALEAGYRYQVVDLALVTFIDSSGLGALIGGLKACRQANGDMRIARPQRQARTVLQLTTLDRILTPFSSVEEALANYGV